MPYSEPCQYSTKLIEKLKSLDTANQLDFDLINKAICWAKKYHDGQMRKSGEAYYSHPLEVAYMIADYNLKTDVIVASILHDIVEDTEVTADMLLDGFGRRIEEMVDRLTRDRPNGTKLSVKELLSKAYQWGDTDVMLIKLIDRLHNLSTLSCMQKQKVMQQIQETCNSLFPGVAALFSLNLEKRLFLALQKEDTQNIHRSAYNINYNSSVDYADFKLPGIELKIE